MEKSTIFKYYSPSEYSLDALFNHYLWFSRRNFLNDPFDLAGFRYNRQNIDRFISVYKLLSAKNLIEPKEIKQLYEYLERKATENKEKNTSNKFSIDYATCCFTDSPHNRLMWAYYAQNYSGWCIEFDSEIDKLELNLRKVSYFDPNNVNNLSFSYFKDLLYLKHIDWNHEKEWRMVIPCRSDIAGKTKAYDRSLIKNIFIGNKISPQYKKLLGIFCESNNINPIEIKFDYNNLTLK